MSPAPTSTAIFSVLTGTLRDAQPCIPSQLNRTAKIKKGILDRNADLSFLKGRIPAETHGVRRLIIFALNHELCASLIETKYFVCQVEAIGDETEAMRQPDAALRVNLQVGVEILVAERALESTGSRCGRRAVLRGRAILKSIGGDVGLVVAQAKADGDSAAVIGRANIPGIGSVAEKPRMIGTARESVCARIGIAIVRGNSEPGQWSRQKRKVLKVGSFKARNPGASRINRLR